MEASISDTFGWMLDHLAWSVVIGAVVVLAVVSVLPVTRKTGK